MLFDLRSGGRRRTVKVVYLGLAMLMFVGFVGFGIGSSGLGGGIGDAITGNGSDGGGDEAAVERLTTQVQTADAKTKTAPTDPAAWAALAQARVRLAAVGDNLDSATGQLHRRGPPPAHRRRQPRGTSTSRSTRRPPTSASPARWPRPSSRSSNPDRAVGAQEVVTQIEPDPADLPEPRASSPTRPARLRKGDLAAAKAVDLAPKDEQKDLKTQLDAGQGPGRPAADPAGRRRPRRPTVG